MYLEHEKHEDVLEPKSYVDHAGELTQAGSSRPTAQKRSGEWRRQNERCAYQVRDAQVLYQHEMSGAHLDAVVADVVDDASVGADGQ